MGPEDRLAGLSRIGIDTSPFIYLIEGRPDRGATAQVLFARLAPVAKVASIVSVIEVLTFCHAHDNHVLAQEYRTFFRGTPEIEVVNVDWDVAEKAAEIRAVHRLFLPDAVQIATAVIAGADAFLTNDRKFLRVKDIPVLIFDDLAL